MKFDKDLVWRIWDFTEKAICPECLTDSLEKVTHVDTSNNKFKDYVCSECGFIVYDGYYIDEIHDSYEFKSIKTDVLPYWMVTSFYS